MMRQAMSRLSSVTFCATWSMIAAWSWPCSSERMWLAIDTRSRSLQVTCARLPARLCTMSRAASLMRASSGSSSQSLITSSRVVVQAIVTERSTTGVMISRMARSMPIGTIFLRCGCEANSTIVGSNDTRMAPSSLAANGTGPGPWPSSSAESGTRTSCPCPWPWARPGAWVRSRSGCGRLRRSSSKRPCAWAWAWACWAA
mmetsp:Transcript_5628/g.21764  ORF Transcript_5628/g.21764 Transcript_5628/m.21764 type:complete len:201 (-) Transcript_5628:835-1437(-)